MRASIPETIYFAGSGESTGSQP